MRELEQQLDPARLPRHVAIIMDGNGRWAKQRGWSDRIRGHEAGAKAVRETVESCARLSIQALTLYAFSLENWQRPQSEISTLMRLLRRFLVQERPALKKNNIRLIASGRLDDLPPAARNTLRQTCNLTRDNTGLTLNLALSYSGREEIAHAARALAREAAEGRLEPDRITPEMIAERLYAPELGDPDLLIRTSGEWRISNFLLWQMAYTEIYVTEVLWPDFRRVHLLEALVDYQRRERRFGKVS
ncbi:MAG TPA: isoprenyl transferase [Sumerlaeia bacterium]|nr:isoprenyl transferase [Sumerlaeia bacterium]